MKRDDDIILLFNNYAVAVAAAIYKLQINSTKFCCNLEFLIWLYIGKQTKNKQTKSIKEDI